MLLRQLYGLYTGARLRDDLQIRLRLENAAQALPEQVVVVRKQNPDLVYACIGSR